VTVTTVIVGGPRREYRTNQLDDSLVYYSPQYGRFLESLLNAESRYFFVGARDEPDGLLPMLMVDGPFGAVANSLPFFGSHGAPVAKGNDPGIVEVLLGAAEQTIEELALASMTIVENPFHPISETQIATLKYLRPVDSRISQITHWPHGAPADDEELISHFHSKHRNAIRKGRATGQVVVEASSEEEWEFLLSEHQRGIAGLGGVAKDAIVFEQLRTHLGSALRLHCGYVSDRLVSALLTIRYRSMVEYFVPVVAEDMRSEQVLPHLVAQVMLDSFRHGATAWNWGGTWLNQDGVFRFKDRFASTNRPYRYLHWCNDRITNADRADLLTAHRYWYTRKFG
jgi:hypothetical protein